MPYDIFGFVETHPHAPGPWRAAFSIDDAVGRPDHVSATVFGLSKFAQPDAPFGNRGLPAAISLDVQDWMASAASLASEEDVDGYDHGHTFATLAELRNVDASESVAWQTLIADLDELRRNAALSDTDIRVVLWANW